MTAKQKQRAIGIVMEGNSPRLFILDQMGRRRMGHWHEIESYGNFDDIPAALKFLGEVLADEVEGT